MADIAELHQQEARELPVRQHSKLIFQQFALACHQLCHRTPDLRRYLISRFKPDIHQYLVEETLNNTSYKQAINSIHQDAVRTAIESSSSKLFNGQPPTIATAEQTLPRKTKTTIAQLRTRHSQILGQYMKRIEPTAHNHCHDCGHSPHDTHHIIDCPSKPTKLTVESLWTALTEAAKHLKLAIDDDDDPTTPSRSAAMAEVKIR